MPAAPSLPPLTRWPAFHVLAVGVFMSTLDSSIVNVALPVIREHFRAPLHVAGWVPLSYLLAITVTLLGFGRLGDRHGQARVYRQGLLLFTLASLLCGLAPRIGVLVAARVVQALGASMIMSMGPALLFQVFPANMRGRALGAMSVAVNVGLTSGPVLGGLITQVLSWRYIFLLNLPIGLAGWWMARRLHDGREAPAASSDPGEAPCAETGSRGRAAPAAPGGARQAEGGDAWGGLLWGLALIALVLPLNRLPAWGLRLWPTGVVLLGGLLLGAAFILQERRSSAPLLPLGLFRSRFFSASLFGGTSLFIYTFIVVYLGPFYLSLLAGLPPGLVGAFFVLGPLGSMATAPLSGWLHDRWGARWLTLFGLALNSATFYGLTRLGADPPLFLYGALLVTLGLGNGIFMPPNTSAFLGAAPRERVGLASGLLATGRTLGMVLGVALGGAIFESVYGRLTGGSTLAEFDPALHAAAFAGAWQAATRAGLAVCLLSLVVVLIGGGEAKAGPEAQPAGRPPEPATGASRPKGL